MIMTMINLAYRVPQSVRHGRAELESARANDIEYYLFPGDVFFEALGVNFDAAWGWVPVLGFALRLAEACQRLEEGDLLTSVTFTESDDAINFVRNARTVMISATYVSTAAEAPVDALGYAARQFLSRVHGELCARFAGLEQNVELADRIRGLLHLESS